MFRDMRRKNQQMSEEEAINILTSLSYGVLGLVGDGGYPYTVPLNYVAMGSFISTVHQKGTRLTL